MVSNVAFIRNSLEMVNEFRKIHMMFVPVPVKNGNDAGRLLRLTHDRMDRAIAGNIDSPTDYPDDQLKTVAWQLMDDFVDPDTKLVYELKKGQRNGDKALVFRDNAISVVENFRERLADWYAKEGYKLDEDALPNAIRSFSVTELPND